MIATDMPWHAEGEDRTRFCLECHRCRRMAAAPGAFCILYASTNCTSSRNLQKRRRTCRAAQFSSVRPAAFCSCDGPATHFPGRRLTSQEGGHHLYCKMFYSSRTRIRRFQRGSPGKATGEKSTIQRHREWPSPPRPDWSSYGPLVLPSWSLHRSNIASSCPPWAYLG
jgi:hypothetical protein